MLTLVGAWVIKRSGAMPPVIRLIIPVLIAAIIGMISVCIKRNNTREIINNLSRNHIVIRLPKAYVWIGCAGSLMFLLFMLLMIYYPNDSSAVWVWIIFSFFFLLGIYISANAIIWRVDIYKNEKCFTVRTLPYKTHIIHMDECISFRRNCALNLITIKTLHKTFLIDNFACNLDFLLAMLTTHNVNEVR